MDKSVLYNLSYGMYIVSTNDGDRNVGCVANSVFQVTSSPLTLAVSINKDNFTNKCILSRGHFAVSILSEKINPNIIGVFGFSSSKDTNKFDDVEFITADSGIPVITSGVCGYIECRVINSFDCFTHTLVFAEIVDAVSLLKEPCMTYSYYHQVIKGKSPKNAPTFIEETKENKSKYVCSICGYEYPGSVEEFLALPDSYECPLCSAPKSAFELIE